MNIAWASIDLHSIDKTHASLTLSVHNLSSAINPELRSANLCPSCLGP